MRVIGDRGMTQIERIRKMEGILNDAAQALKNLEHALERFESLNVDIALLEAYYTGPQWMADYRDDCDGKLPDDLRRGVLSEDAVYDLLSTRDRLLEDMRTAGSKTESKEKQRQTRR